MSRDLGRDVPDLEKLYARKLWADFSYPILRSEKNKRGWKTQGRGKHTIKPLPKNGFGPPHL